MTRSDQIAGPTRAGGDMAVLLMCMALATLPGCAGPGRGHAVPADFQEKAVIPGMPAGIRTWAAEVNPEFHAELFKTAQRERAARASSGQAETLGTAEFLAISGGGQNGAYTAGLLNGWTAAGTRPQFKAVTGISTGALIAPFAFLGPEYDATLRAVYTQTTTQDILQQRNLLGALFNDALADNKPLWRLLERYVDQKLLDAIAAEYGKGRVLLVGTTNLDALRGVIWNVGAIAASGHPDALALVRKILIASAAIPAAFPPVLIDVEVDGQRYQELHVDGGAITQVFLYPPSMKLKAEAEAAGVVRQRRLYIIRNARLDPDWAETERRTLPIAGRAINSLLHTQGVGDLYRIYVNAQRDEIDYNLAFIPASFKVEAKEAFDKPYMNALYQVGYELGRSGYPWLKSPPAFEAPRPPQLSALPVAPLPAP